MDNIILYIKSGDNFVYYKSFDNISLAIQPNSKDSSKIEISWKLYSINDLTLPVDIQSIYDATWGIHFNIGELKYKILNCKLEKLTLGPDLNSTSRLVYLGTGDIPQLR